MTARTGYELAMRLRDLAQEPMKGSYCDEDDDCRTMLARELCREFGILYQPRLPDDPRSDQKRQSP